MKISHVLNFKTIFIITLPVKLSIPSTVDLIIQDFYKEGKLKIISKIRKTVVFLDARIFLFHRYNVYVSTFVGSPVNKVNSGILMDIKLFMLNPRQYLFGWDSMFVGTC